MLNLRDALRARRLCRRCHAMPPGHPDRGEGPCPECGDTGFVGEEPHAGGLAHLLGAESLPALLCRLTEQISEERRREIQAQTCEDILVAAARRSGLAMAASAIQSYIIRTSSPFPALRRKHAAL